MHHVWHRYLPGGFFKRHHDYILRSVRTAGFDNCGPRQLTFMLYLNDLPPAPARAPSNGGTSFYGLGLVVEPKAGRALLWPDVLPDRPFERDERTAHEALLVHAGTKYVATTWWQAFDIHRNSAAGCCG